MSAWKCWELLMIRFHWPQKHAQILSTCFFFIFLSLISLFSVHIWFNFLLLCTWKPGSILFSSLQYSIKRMGLKLVSRAWKNSKPLDYRKILFSLYVHNTVTPSRRSSPPSSPHLYQWWWFRSVVNNQVTRTPRRRVVRAKSRI